MRSDSIHWFSSKKAKQGLKRIAFTAKTVRITTPRQAGRRRRDGEQMPLYLCTLELGQTSSDLDLRIMKKITHISLRLLSSKPEEYKGYMKAQGSEEWSQLPLPPGSLPRTPQVKYGSTQNHSVCKSTR